MATHDSIADRFAPGTALDDRALDGLRRALSARYRRRVSLTSVRPSVSSRTDELRLQRFVANAFGRRIVWYTSNDPASTEGATLAGTNDRVFVRAGTDLPAARIVGHELVHSFRRADPNAYSDLALAVEAIAVSRDLYKDRIHKAYADDSRDRPSDAIVDEEFVADVVGAHFSEPGFMRELAARMEPSPFKRFVHHAIGWLERVEAKLQGGPHGAFVKRHTRDAKQARRAMLSALARLSHHRGIVATPGDNPAIQGVLDWHNMRQRTFDYAPLPETRVDEQAWGLFVDDYAGVASLYKDRLTTNQATNICLPGDDEFLVGNRTLSEQPAGVQNLLMLSVWTGVQPFSGLYFRGDWDSTTGEQLYDLLRYDSSDHTPSARRASAILSLAGVPGLCYDQSGERLGGQGYLVFDETLMRAPPSAMDRASADSLRYMVAWHGSPHQFDRFTTERIGQGEGAAAFGYGLYFAENRNVAESYRKTLTSNSIRFPDGTAQRLLTYGDFDTFQQRLSGLLESEGLNIEVEQEAAQFILHADTCEVIMEGFELAEGGVGDIVETTLSELEMLAVREAQRIKDNLDASPEAAILIAESYQQAATALSHLMDLGMRQAVGGLYEVEIDRDDSDFLSLDERVVDSQPELATRLGIPLDSKEAKRVLEEAESHLGRTIDADDFTRSKKCLLALSARDEALKNYERSTWTGKDMHDHFCVQARLSREDDPSDTWAPFRYDSQCKLRSPVAMVSAYFASEGLCGIRYLDGLSRQKGTGTSNYVIFDENLVSVRACYARPDVSQRVGKGMTPHAIESGLAAPLARLRRHVDVVVTNQLPEQYLSEPDARDVEGAYRDGKIILFARHLGGAEHARRILRHESVGHFGIQRIVGSQWPVLASQIQSLIKQGDATLTMQAERASKRYPELSPDSDDFTAEVIAGLCERADPHPLLSQVNASFCRFMRKMHLMDPAGISIHEVRDLIRQASDAIDSPPDLVTHRQARPAHPTSSDSLAL